MCSYIDLKNVKGDCKNIICGKIQLSLIFCCPPPPSDSYSPFKYYFTFQLFYLLVHVAVHGGDGEVPLVHLLGQPVHLPPRVAENNGLEKKYF